MDDPRRGILEDVRSGALSPSEAEERLSRLTGQPPAQEGTVRTIRVLGSFRTARIIGDPHVREAVAEGQHVARREGDVLVISADDFVLGDDQGGFRFERSSVNIRLGSRPLPLTVRMRPDLALEVTMAAGALKINEVTGPIKANVSAGAIRIEGFASPLDLQVAGGAVAATGRLSEGSSSIRCEAGSVRVRLTSGSSVKVVARAGLGKVVLPGVKGAAFIGGGTQEAIVGDGEGRLDIEASLGAVVVEEE